MLIERLSSDDPTERMPLRGEPLTAREVGLIRAWIDAGAHWPDAPAGAARAASPDWWSLRPLRRPPLPKLDDAEARWVRNSIDVFILARLREAKLAQSPEADRRTLICRLSLDLVGLPPTPEEVDAFAGDPDPLAYEKLVDRLLASPAHGERWAQHWLDLVRYGDTHGFEVNTPRPNAWPYRDWVIRSFNADKPYSQFVLEQLAGDTLGEDEATGFLVAGAALLPGQIGKDVASQRQARQDELHETLSTTSTAFLGLTAGCARCHSHKFDPIPQDDYYALQAVFAGLKYGERAYRTDDPGFHLRLQDQLAAELVEVERALDEGAPFASEGRPGLPRRAPVVPGRNVDRFEPVEARSVRFVIERTNDGTEPCVDELEVFTADAPRRNVALAAAGCATTASSTRRNSAIHRLEHLNDGRYGNSRSWLSGQRGEGWLQIDLPAPARIDRVVWGRDREGRYKDRLAVAYRIEVALEPGQWRVVASAKDREDPSAKTAPASDAASALDKERAALIKRQSALSRRLAELRAGPLVFAGVFQAPAPTFRLHRGDPMQPREAIAPGTFSALREPLGSLQLAADAPESQRRLALARWIIRPDNPLTPRVLVNRIWQYHFGTGIVDTPSDFGRNGTPPTHPELLDDLALRLVESGWSLKALHRLIVVSATYRQANTPRADALESDAQSRLLWRYPPRRLEAEAIRDRILDTAGSLDRRMGGPGFLVFKPNSNYVRVYDPKEAWDPEDWRRMVYMHKVRMAQDGVFGVFDCPDAGQPAPKRSRSTTALQALSLFNSTFIVQQAAVFAQRVEQEVGMDRAAQVDRAFRLALQRSPTEAERKECTDAAGAHGLALVCRVLFNTNEFLLLP